MGSLFWIYTLPLPGRSADIEHFLAKREIQMQLSQDVHPDSDVGSDRIAGLVDAHIDRLYDKKRIDNCDAAERQVMKAVLLAQARDSDRLDTRLHRLIWLRSDHLQLAL